MFNKLAKYKYQINAKPDIIYPEIKNRINRKDTFT